MRAMRPPARSSRSASRSGREASSPARASSSGSMRKAGTASGLRASSPRAGGSRPRRSAGRAAIHEDVMLMHSPPRVSVVVPAKDEAGNLPALVDEIAAALAGQAFEIVVVNDGSRDDTAAVLARLAL